VNKKDSGIFLPSITLIIAIAGFIFGIKFLMPSIIDNQAKISAANEDIAAAQAKLDSIATANSTMTKLSDLVNNLLIAVPDNIDSPDLIAEIETIAGQNQVGMPSLTPPKAIDSTSAANAGKSGLSVSVVVTGSFSNINNFISALESSIRFSKITSLTISSAVEGALSTTISFDVYSRPIAKTAGLTGEGGQ